MRKHTKFIARTVVLVAAGWCASCNGKIDNEPNVILEVQNMTISPITSSANGQGGSCTYTVTPATGTFKNAAKNQFAGTSPFNDIILQSVLISYTWDDFADGVVQPPVTAGIGGSVPAGGTSSAQFSVISSRALAVDNPSSPGTGRSGHTASLGLTFFGTTVSGEAVSASTGGTLQVNSCIVIFGACCGAPNPGCNDSQSQADCTAAGGTYQGDNTTCTTLPNSCPSSRPKSCYPRPLRVLREGAVSFWGTIVTQESGESFATLTHARVRAAQGDVRGALRILHVILDVQPGHREARRLLAELLDRVPVVHSEPADVLTEAVTPATTDELAGRFRETLGALRSGTRRQRLTSWLERTQRNRGARHVR